MKRILIAIVVLTAGIILAQNLDSTEIKRDDDLTKKIEQVIKLTSKIQPGMTRGDLLKVYGEEGGLSHRSSRRYAYRGCPYIKVDVEFKPVDESLNENPNDIITKISKPFLEYSIID